MLLLKIAFRNIFRQRRRSFFTGLTMVVGFVLMSFSLSIQEGMYDRMIDMFTKDHTGHVQIHSKGYLDKPTLYNNITNYKKLLTDLKTIDGVDKVAPRIFYSGLFFKEQKTAGGRIVGIDVSLENQTTNLKHKVSSGDFLTDEHKYEVVIGNGLAKNLKAQVGNEISLITQAADGSMSYDNFTIKGILGDDNDLTERNNCYLPLSVAQEFLALEGKIHEIAIVLDHFKNSRSKAKAINNFLNSKDYTKVEAKPWEEVEKQFYKSMKADKEGAVIFLVIIVIILAIGVLNTVLMSILERTREYGVLKAVGTRGSNIFKMIIYESVILATICIVIASILATPLLIYTCYIGFPYPEPVTVSGIMITHMQGVIDYRFYLYPSLVVVLSAVIVSILPAIRAAVKRPVDSLRSF